MQLTHCKFRLRVGLQIFLNSRSVFDGVSGSVGRKARAKRVTTHQGPMLRVEWWFWKQSACSGATLRAEMKLAVVRLQQHVLTFCRLPGVSEPGQYAQHNTAQHNPRPELFPLKLGINPTARLPGGWDPVLSRTPALRRSRGHVNREKQETARRAVLRPARMSPRANSAPLALLIAW